VEAGRGARLDNDPPEAAPPQPEYRSPEGVAKTLVALLAVSLLIDLIASISDLAEINLLTRIQEGAVVTDQEADANDRRQGMIGLAQTVAFIATAITFLVWFRRLYRNIPPLRVGPLRYRPGWAVGAWFVPILNLFRPKQIMNDIWRASDPVDGYRPASLEGRGVPFLVNAWWAMFLVSSAFDRATLAALEAETVDELLASAKTYAVSDAFNILLSAVAIAVVVSVTKRQRIHAEHIFGSDATRPQAL